MNNVFPITATFIDEITYDVVSQNWHEKDWKKDFDSMQEIGIDTVVIMRSIFNDKILYPSNFFADKKNDYGDFLKFVFEEADKRRMNVYLGMHIANLTWNDGDYKNEIQLNKLFIDEIVDRYSKYNSFVGWYIPHETGHDSYNIIPTIKGLIGLIKQYTPNKKIMISPFFRGLESFPHPRLSPGETYKVWDYIFSFIGKDIDICAFQDGTAPVDKLGEYLKEIKCLCNKYNIEMWSNVETFSREPDNYLLPLDFEIIIKKIDDANKYVQKCITFEFSHFLSPNSIYKKARENYKKYLEYYRK